MKKTLFFTLLLSLSFSLLAQDEEDSVVQDHESRYREDEIRTLFGHDRLGGVYGAFTGGYSEINGLNAVLFGGRFGWMAGHSLGVGFGGTGFLNEYHYEQVLDRDVFLAGGYGGLYLEPILLPKMPVHLSFPILFGAGGISYISKYDQNETDNFIEDSEAFLILEPSAEIEFNLTRFIRFAAGATYRLPTSFNLGLSDIPGVRTSALRGWSYTVSIKFGRF